MARRLGGDNTLWIQDTVSGDKLGVKYRMPEPGELVSYRNGGTKRKGKRIVPCIGENRLKYGEKILTGVEDGSFERQKDGKWIPISSDPASEHYDPDWKPHVVEMAPDIIETLAVTIFDGSNQVDDSDDAEDLEKN